MFCKCIIVLVYIYYVCCNNMLLILNLICSSFVHPFVRLFALFFFVHLFINSVVLIFDYPFGTSLYISCMFKGISTWVCTSVVSLLHRMFMIQL